MLGAIAVAGCGGAGADVIVAPDWAGERMAVPGTVRGHNTVWSRGGLGIWDDEVGAIDEAAWPHVEALAPGALRFPGGTRGLRWHFGGTLGDARTAQCDAFTGELDATGYGMDEMLAVAARAGAPITLVTPLSDGTPDEAAAMLAFAVGDAADPTAIGDAWGTVGSWAAQRTAPAADVRLVEIGNEPYLHLAVGPSTSCGRAARFRQDVRWEGDVAIEITAADYAAQVSAHAAALRAVDPDVVVGAAAMSEYPSDGDDISTAIAPNDDAVAWNPRLAADGAFDAWILHPYDFSALDERITLAERARTASRALVALAPDRAVAVTEFGTLFDGDSMLNAILTADFVRVAVEERWLVLLRHILIEDDPGEPFAASAAILGPDHAHTPGWEVAHALVALRSEAAPVAVDADDLAVLATFDPGEVAILLIDRRLLPADPPRVVELRLPPGAWTGTATTIAGHGLTAREVDVTATEVTGDGSVLVELSPTSVTVVHVLSPG
jgi:hypothetical protein